MREECKSPRIKRIIDFVIAALCLILFSPLILVCWLLIKNDGQPVIYKQERIGLGGKPFYIYKFRSMVAARCPLSAALRLKTWCHQLCDPEKRLYRHHR